MSRTFLFILAVVFLLAGCSSSNRIATCFYSTAIERTTLPLISFDPVNFVADGKPRLDVLFQIPFKNLKFQKAGNAFVATYSVTVRVLTSDEKQIAIQEWSKTVSVKDYERTVSNESEATLRVFVLPPEKYTLAVTILDEHSQQQQEERKEVNVHPAVGQFEASDIVLLQKITEDQGIKTITPMFPSDIGKFRSFSTFMEVYDSLGIDTLYVSTRIVPFHIDYDRRHQSSPYSYKSFFNPKYLFTPRYDQGFVRPDTIAALGGPNIPLQDLFLPKLDNEFARSDTIVITVGSPTQLFNSFIVPPPGRYQLLTEVVKKKEGKTDTLHIGRVLTVHSEYFPDVVDSDDLIGPLQYITERDEYDSLRAPANKEERARRLEQFWNTKLDPARRQEFYGRVRQANEYFTGIVDGWRTPMGMTYIVAGPPAELECQPGISETWYYGYQQSYVVFIFQTGPGAQNDGHPFYMLTGYPAENVWSNFVDKWRR